jgi:hypothetical protein
MWFLLPILSRAQMLYRLSYSWGYDPDNQECAGPFEECRFCIKYNDTSADDRFAVG